MACNCKPKPHTPPQTPGECLCINDLRIGCDEGPAPCGIQRIIDLTLNNDVTASPCDVVYMLKSFDQGAFQSVTLTEEGILTVVTSNTYVKHEEFEIRYKVDSPCSLLSDEGSVYICMKDLCKSKMCSNGCDHCTGDCKPIDPEIQITRSKPEIKFL